jgi:hypothetical protein
MAHPLRLLQRTGFPNCRGDLALLMPPRGPTAVQAIFSKGRRRFHKTGELFYCKLAALY